MPSNCWIEGGAVPMRTLTALSSPSVWPYMSVNVPGTVTVYSVRARVAPVITSVEYCTEAVIAPSAGDTLTLPASLLVLSSTLLNWR